jgi:hypothetical protein
MKCDEMDIAEITNVYKLLVETPDKKGPLGRPRHRWKIIFVKLILKKQGVVCARDSSGPG